MPEDINSRGRALIELAQLRMAEFGHCAHRLSKAAEDHSRRASTIRILLIVLGALVTTKGIADQLMIDFKEHHKLHMAVLIGYTLIGVAISIAASMDSIFQFSKKASALALLASDARAGSRHYMAAVQIANSPEALKEMKKLVDEMNKDLEAISRKSADLGINLALDNPVDFSHLLDEK